MAKGRLAAPTRNALRLPVVDEVYRQRKIIKLEDTKIPVVPIKELIRMKEKSNRPQDQADVFYLKKIMDEWKDEE